MQQNDSPDAIAAKFVTLAEEEGECKLRGDYKRGNLLVKKINRLVSSIQNENGKFGASKGLFLDIETCSQSWCSQCTTDESIDG